MRIPGPPPTRVGVWGNYRLLETAVVPLDYERDATGLPGNWLDLVRRCIRTLAPRFSTRRMVKEYAEQFYLAAIA